MLVLLRVLEEVDDGLGVVVGIVYAPPSTDEILVHPVEPDLRNGMDFVL